MNLGKFSVSLSVKDIEKSVDFYQKMGFKIIDGGHTNKGFADTDKMKWRILENSSVKIGLFQGMFKSNVLTFYPSDVLAVQQIMKEQGVEFSKEADPDSKNGYFSATLTDPDGNKILLDQI